LILEPGVFTTSNADGHLIDKALILRASSAHNQSLFHGNLVVEAGQDETVIIQGLALRDDLVARSAGNLQVLENSISGSFLGGAYRSTEQDGDLAVIGNIIQGGIYDVRTWNAYIAGNTLNAGRITAYQPLWIVGNKINSSSASIYVDVGGIGAVQVIGNRVRTTGYEWSIWINAAYALVAGNLAVTTDINGHGITSAGQSQVFNNTISNTYQNSGYRWGKTGISATGKVSGNIVVGMANYDGYDAIKGSESTGVTGNLCYSTGGGCGSNALTEDPKFGEGYQLGTGSPAIDAGPEAPELGDLDGTRNDMGAYGGPWSIAQYDAQRDPSYTAPYAFPLFDTEGLVSGNQLRVRALGVARFR
jgi:hypothetical protein